MLPGILVLPATARPGAACRMLALELSRLLALSEANVALLDLSDYPLPLHDAGPGHPGEPVPEAARRLAEQLAARDMLVLVGEPSAACVPPLLINALNWIAAVRDGRDRPVPAFRELLVGLAATGAGPQGDGGCLAALRATMLARGARVVSEECRLIDREASFDAAGRLREETARAALGGFVQTLLEYARPLGRHG